MGRRRGARRSSRANATTLSGASWSTLVSRVGKVERSGLGQGRKRGAGAMNVRAWALRVRGSAEASGICRADLLASGALAFMERARTGWDT